MLRTEVWCGWVVIECGNIRDPWTGVATAIGRSTPVVETGAAADLVGVPGCGGGIEVDFDWEGHCMVVVLGVGRPGWGCHVLMGRIRIPGREERRGTGIFWGWEVICF